MENRRYCSHCHIDVLLPKSPLSLPQFCPFCGQSVEIMTEMATTSTLAETSYQASIVPGTAPQDEPIVFTMGTYQILRKIAQGGMGEVFLAYDTICGRRIALKRIRQDLSNHPHLYQRFLKEARITGQLTHPAIIPIYAIHQENHHVYYTMPYVEGETLKQILRDTKRLEREDQSPHPIGGSIAALLRIFMNICHAVSYAHSHGVLHRDLKPENIIIGKFGEVLILDWGLAKLFEESQPEVALGKEPQEPQENGDALTHGGRIVGTVSYMAPERALGFPATKQTDIYSLGVILYTFLTLRLPFRRKSIREFKKKMHQERFIDPGEIAPYRDVPQMLSRVVQRCLAPNMENRYEKVEELIHDIENYLAGGSEWFLVGELDITNGKHWEFQENVLLPGTLAITRNAEEAEWVSLMISKTSFAGNTKIEARVSLGELSQGIGFLLNVPEASQRLQLTDGYCLWLGSDTHRATKLLRSSVEVVHAPDIFLQRGEWVDVRIEQNEQNIAIYLNNNLQFSYLGLMPLMGTHVGLLTRDYDFFLDDWKVYVRSLSVMINCLAIPDAFLFYKDYDKALSEYERISYSFPGRMEGREALFRAGFTLIAKAHQADNPEPLLEKALTKFEKLHNTPGAPLEYLGKALVYQALGDLDEEAKCFELALRRYPKHPLLPVLQEQLIFRLHKSSRTQRKATYLFVLIASRLLPKERLGEHTLRLFSSLKKNWEPLTFWKRRVTDSDRDFAASLGFWLHKTYVFHELLEELREELTVDLSLVNNIFFSLLVMKEETRLADEVALWCVESVHAIPYFSEWLEMRDLSLNEKIRRFLSYHPRCKKSQERRFLTYYLQEALDHGDFSLVLETLRTLDLSSFPTDEVTRIDAFRIWALLLAGSLEEAGQHLHSYPLEILHQESSLFHTLYGCWLAATEGKDLADVHFLGVVHVTYPRSWCLLGHYLTDSIAEESNWFKNAFWYEKKQLYRQLSLYFHCLHNTEKSRLFQQFVLENRS